MDLSQIESAAEIWSNPRSSQELKSQAFDYLTQLKSDPQGWQACVTLFAKQPQTSEVVRLVCLEVVNAAVYSQALNAESLSSLWLTPQLSHFIPTQPFQPLNTKSVNIAAAKHAGPTAAL